MNLKFKLLFQDIKIELETGERDERRETRETMAGALVPRSKEDVRRGVRDYGATPAAREMMHMEQEAAEFAVRGKVYVTWTSESVGENTQCARVGPRSSCSCGHSLRQHGNGILKPPRPPRCSRCSCSGFSYSPRLPEELGLWHLSRRRDFDVKAFRSRVRASPGNYCCINCDQKVSDHVTLFESERDRIASGRLVGEAYFPLADEPEIREAVGLKAAARKEKQAIKTRQQIDEISPEEKLQAGMITVNQYHQLITQGGTNSMERNRSSNRQANNSGVSSSANNVRGGMTFSVQRLDRNHVAISNLGSRPVPRGGKSWVRTRPSSKRPTKR